MGDSLIIKDGDGDEIRVTIYNDVVWIDTEKTCLYFLDRAEILKLADFITKTINSKN